MSLECVLSLICCLGISCVSCLIKPARPWLQFRVLRPRSSLTWRSVSCLSLLIPWRSPPEQRRSSPGMVTRTAGGNSAFHNFHNDYAHIADPNERRRLALAEIDKAPFGWYHVRAIIVAGIGFFTVSFSVSSLNEHLTRTGRLRHLCNRNGDKYAWNGLLARQQQGSHTGIV